MDGRGFNKCSHIGLIKNLANEIRRFLDLECNVDIGLECITVTKLTKIIIGNFISTSGS